VLIGCHIVGQTNLNEVEDEFASDSDEELGSMRMSAENIVVQTFDSSSAFVIVQKEVGQYVRNDATLENKAYLLI